MLTHSWLDGALVVLMAIGVIGVLTTQIIQNKGIGPRVIQFIGVCLVVPTILILAIEDKIDKQNLGTIVGAIIGYVLAGIGENERSTTTTPAKPDTSKQDSSSSTQLTTPSTG
jgi:hypothetical protein